MNQDSIFHRAGEEIKKDREKMNGKPFRKKVQYFFMYYKVPFFIIVAIIAIIISVAYSRFQNKEFAFNVFFVNASNTRSDETFGEEFGEVIDMDDSKYMVSVDSSIYIDTDGTSQMSVAGTEKLAMEINSAVLDACIMPQNLFEAYAEEGSFGDLSDFLTEEQMENYADRIVYVDDIPVGIEAGDFAKIEEAELYEMEDAPVFAIIYNAPHADECSLFLDYLNDL